MFSFVLQHSKLTLRSFCFSQNKHVAAEYQVSYSVEEQEFLFFLKQREQEVTWQGERKDLFF